MNERTVGLARLAQTARRTAWRLRLSETVARAAALALLPALYAAAALTAIKVFRAGPSLTRGLAWGAALPVAIFVAGSLHAALRSRPRWGGALALDETYGLKDRVTNALAFSSLPDAERTPMMEAAIEDALAVARDLSPRRAAPVRVPRDAFALFGLGLAIAVIALLEVPVRRFVPRETSHVDALHLTADDVDLFRKMSDDLTAQTTDPAAAAGARRFNQLVEDLAERRIDRSEVFRRLDELERSMKEPMGVDPAALDDSLDGIAKELDKSPMSKPVAQALSEKKLADAEQAMRELAKKVENAKRDVDKAKLESLKSALKKSAETVQNKTTRTDDARKSLEETRRRLLEKKQKQGLSKEEREELDRTERQLQRLDREKSKQEGDQRQLSGLDRDLAKAAQDLMKDLGAASQDLEQGARDINRTAQQKLTDEQKREILRQLEELRQILRQEGQAGRERLKRMLSFGQRAHGGSGKEGEGQGGRGQDGKSGTGEGMGEGESDGKRGAGKKPGFGVVRPGGGTMVTLTPGGLAPSNGGEGQQQGGAGDQGSEWGTGHDPNVKGDPTKLAGHTEDVTAAGADTGQGASVSQSIYGAAERGFVGRGYKKVYTDYHQVAEEVLGHDEIPPGYRFYVRRYFQLIRPRD